MGAIILLALSVSLDSLSTGMAYAISGIRIPWTTKLMMAVLNGCLTFSAVLAGSYLGQIIRRGISSYLGEVCCLPWEDVLYGVCGKNGQLKTMTRMAQKY